MRQGVERRRPDRHLVALRLLRRITVVALVATALLWTVPRLLIELGLLGPGPQEAVEAADRAILLARRYGAADLPDFQRAEMERDRARALARAGEGREARRASERSIVLATEAQKQALVRQAQRQQQAQAVYDDLDRQINDLEKLYSTVTPNLEKQEVSKLLSLMKGTRQLAGGVFLAYENEDWDGVLRDEAKAREVISSTRRTLQESRRP